ncbi:MAG: PorP/SprF family type IX secretion system membrane protein [Bacteroidia bacterium]|nr:PorP/SprF family type IX secretion system membrane protein [Bacteroidia bacterium]
MKKILLLSVGSIMVVYLNAQSFVRDNLYSYNPFMFNPAYTGSTENLSSFLDVRSQWFGYEGAPKAYTFGSHAPISNKMGLGGIISTFKSGLFENYSANIHYSYFAKIDDNQSMRMGLSAGFSNFRLNNSKLYVLTPDDPTLVPDYYNKNVFIGGAGVQYKFKTVQVDIGLPQLFDAEMRFIAAPFTMASYTHYFHNNDLAVSPVVLYNYTANEFHQADFNVKVDWKKMAWIQLGYRTNKSALWSIGVNFRDVGIAYAFEIPNSKFSVATSGSHQICLFYHFRLKESDASKSDTVKEMK